jgi:hypothetical protein
MVGKAKKTKLKLEEKFWLDDKERLKRLSALLKQEIERILFDLDFRKDLLFKLWSKERLREPLLRVLHSRFFELDFHDLILLPKELSKNVDGFYRELDTFIFYVSYTEDMPHTMKIKFDTFVKSLKLSSVGILEELSAICDVD